MKLIIFLIHRWKLKDDINDSVGSSNGTNFGTRLATVEDKVAAAIKAARTTANDLYFISSSGKQNLEITTVVVEEAP